ncbi:hypothetical protein Tco_0490481, partial [Tanacetum coccineum]
MSNTNMQNQTSNALHNAIMEAGGKDHPPMLAPVAEGSSETTTEGYMENYKNVLQDIRDQLNAEAEAVQIILTWFVTLVKRSQELKTVSYDKLYDILKQHQNEVNDIRAERLAPARNRGKAIVNSSAPIYDQEPATVTEDDEMTKEKEIDKLMALISLSFKKIYKPTNNNLRTSSNTSRANQDNSPRINRGTGIWAFNQKECQNRNVQRMQLITRKRCYCIQEVTPDPVDNSRPIFDAEPLHKVQNNNDNYNVFAIENEHPEQPESVNDIYLEEQGDTNITIDSLDICYDREQDDQDDTDELDQELDKLKGDIEDLKTKNKSLESSNNHFKEANNELSKTNQLMFKELKKFQAELDKYRDMNYASKVAIDCAKAKGDLCKQNVNLKRVIPTTSVSRPQLKSTRFEDRVMHNISQGKKQEVDDH